MDSWPVNRTDLDAVLPASDALSRPYVPTSRRLRRASTRWSTCSSARARQQEVGGLQPAPVRLPARPSPRSQRALAPRWRTPGRGRWTASRPYREAPANAGQAGNTAYPSVESAAQEKVVGLIASSTRWPTGRLPTPTTRRTRSWWRASSPTTRSSDFANNLRSVENAYLGHPRGRGPRGARSRTSCRLENAELDTRVAGEPTGAIAALGRIPEPFRESDQGPRLGGQESRRAGAIRKARHVRKADQTCSPPGE